jgi:putative ABC transport system permease protein
MGIRLLAGRGFSRHDAAGSTPVAILNQAAAKAIFGGATALAQQIVIPRGRRDETLAVIGIVSDVHSKGLDQGPKPAIYVPMAQAIPYRLEAVIRAMPGVPPSTLAPMLRKQMAQVDVALSGEVTTMQAVIAERLATPLFLTAVLGVFGFLALALTATGIYGVMSHNVRARTHEIGVRIALGAPVSSVLNLAMARGAKLIAAGLILGLAGALAATRVLERLLFEVKPGDPATLAAVSAILALAALAAIWFPARRATRVDPVIALRHD